MPELKGLARAQQLLHGVVDTLEMLTDAEDVNCVGPLLLLKAVVEDVVDEIIEPLATAERLRKTKEDCLAAVSKDAAL